MITMDLNNLQEAIKSPKAIAQCIVCVHGSAIITSSCTVGHSAEWYMPLGTVTGDAIGSFSHAEFTLVAGPHHLSYL